MPLAIPMPAQVPGQQRGSYGIQPGRGTAKTKPDHCPDEFRIGNNPLYRSRYFGVIIRTDIIKIFGYFSHTSGLSLIDPAILLNNCQLPSRFD